MFDKEIEAIAKCTELIKDLDEDAKMRVIKYLIDRFGIGTKSVSYPTPPPQVSKPQITDGQQVPQFVDAETLLTYFDSGIMDTSVDWMQEN